MTTQAVPVLTSALVRDSEAVLARHARSFRWAAPFLPADARADAAVVYAFCRAADDAVDEAASAADAERELSALEHEVAGTAPARAIVRGALDVFARRAIPLEAARDLLAGMRSDLAPSVRIADDTELLLYCYRVAGTVGHMMRGIVQAQDPRAEQPAVSLGIAMQLTNICRDVAEDAARDRVYLPETRLQARGGDAYAVVQDLLALAEQHYARAHAGMRFIPFRARIACFLAARLYRAIGLRILARGPRALESRTVVSPARKLWEACKAVVVVVADAVRGAARTEPVR